MRCRQFLERYHCLIDDRQSPRNDPELCEHARECPRCARWMAAGQLWEIDWQQSANCQFDTSAVGHGWTRTGYWGAGLASAGVLALLVVGQFFTRPSLAPPQIAPVAPNVAAHSLSPHRLPSSLQGTETLVVSSEPAIGHDELAASEPRWLSLAALAEHPLLDRDAWSELQRRFGPQRSWDVVRDHWARRPRAEWVEPLVQQLSPLGLTVSQAWRLLRQSISRDGAEAGAPDQSALDARNLVRSQYC